MRLRQTIKGRTVAVEALPFFAEEAKRRMSEGGKGQQKIADLELGQARDKAAAVTGANRQYVSDAKALKQKAPALFEQVRSGDKTISEAKRELSRSQVRCRKFDPDGRRSARDHDSAARATLCATSSP